MLEVGAQALEWLNVWLQNDRIVNNEDDWGKLIRKTDMAQDKRVMNPQARVDGTLTKF